MYRMATVSENLQDIQTLQINTNSHETSDDDPPESKRKKLEDETKNSSQIVQPAKIQHISDDEESDDGAFCTVCFEPWTNSGEHRIASLKCGHFFGLSCIEKWLRTTGANDCPNCNEKATKKDIRSHYVSRLKAVDTACQDRAIKELEQVKTEFRALELEHTTLKVTNALQREEIDKLRRKLKESHNGLIEPGNQNGNDSNSQRQCSSTYVNNESSNTYSRLLYVKRLELISRPDHEHRERYCRVMVYNDTHGMLAVTQPSFTSLAPGYGVRRVNMLELRVEKYVSLHREPIRNLAFNPLMQDQLLSVSQDKTARITNISSCAEIQRYQCGSEAWACCWDRDTPTTFFVGTKRSQIYMFDTRDSTGPEKGLARQRLEFPISERRPIINMTYVPASASHESFPCGGLLVQTLGSLWFFESQNSDVITSTNQDTSQERDPIVASSFGVIRKFKPNKLPIEGLFWSLKFDLKTRLILVSTKPTPHARHVVCEPQRVRISEEGHSSEDGSHSMPNPARRATSYAVTANTLLDHRKGGSYTDRSFLRSTIFCKPGTGGKTMVVAFGRGSGQSDHKVVIQEVEDRKSVV